MQDVGVPYLRAVFRPVAWSAEVAQCEPRLLHELAVLHLLSLLAAQRQRSHLERRLSGVSYDRSQALSRQQSAAICLPRSTSAVALASPPKRGSFLDTWPSNPPVDRSVGNRWSTSRDLRNRGKLFGLDPAVPPLLIRKLRNASTSRKSDLLGGEHLGAAVRFRVLGWLQGRARLICRVLGRGPYLARPRGRSARARRIAYRSSIKSELTNLESYEHASTSRQSESRQRDLLDDERLCSAVPSLRGAQAREPTHRLCRFLCNRGSYLVRRQDRPVRARRIGEVMNLGSYEPCYVEERS